MRVPVTLYFCQAITILIEYQYIEGTEPGCKSEITGIKEESSQSESQETATKRA